MAMTARVHGPMPGRPVSSSSAWAGSVPRSNPTVPSASAPASVSTEVLRLAGMASTAGSTAAMAAGVGNSG